MKNRKTRFTIHQLLRAFPDDETCLRKIYALRFGGDGPECPKCKRRGFHKRSGRKVWECQWCAYNLSPLAGTIFHKSDTPLTLWFHAVFLMGASRNGVSAKELQRQIGVTYKTAWRMQRQIRSLMAQGKGGMLGGLVKGRRGVVEADETYVGGKARGEFGCRAGGKVPVVGLAERKRRGRRGGRVVARVTADARKSTVMPIVRANVAIGASLMTDDSHVYGKAWKEGYRHRAVKHGKGEYVRGNAHTNTIDGFWSQMKRSISGTYHAVSSKHLQSYVDEFAYRYNHGAFDAPLFPGLLLRAARPCASFASASVSQSSATRA